MRRSTAEIIREFHSVKYFVESNAGWFVVETKTKRQARSVGVKEFGRGSMRQVRQATESEIKEFINIKGEMAIQA